MRYVCVDCKLAGFRLSLDILEGNISPSQREMWNKISFLKNMIFFFIQNKKAFLYFESWIQTLLLNKMCCFDA